VLLARQLERIDKSEIEKLELELGAVKNEIASLGRSCGSSKGRSRDMKKGSRTLSDARTSSPKSSRRRARPSMRNCAKWMCRKAAGFEERYSERTGRSATRRASRGVERQYRTIESRTVNLVQELVSLKTAYVNAPWVRRRGVGGHVQRVRGGTRAIGLKASSPSTSSASPKTKEEAIQQLCGGHHLPLAREPL